MFFFAYSAQNTVFFLDLTLIGDYFKQYIRQTENYLNFLLSDGNQDKLLANVFMDQEFATDFIQDLKSFRSKSLSFNNFKQKYMSLIMKYQLLT